MKRKSKRKGGSWRRGGPDRWGARRPLGLSTLRRGTLGDRAADLVRRRIVLGDVRPGQRLESLRVLAAELGISVGATREAISRLKGEGLVEVRHGVGCFVARRPRAARVMRATWRRASRREAAELRLLVEVAAARRAARQAARRRSHGADAGLIGALWERERAARSGRPAEYVKADMELHLQVLRASRMAMAAAAGRMATAVLRPDLRAKAREHAADARLDGLHRAMVEAIEQGRPDRAGRAARAIAWIEARPP